MKHIYLTLTAIVFFGCQLDNFLFKKEYYYINENELFKFKEGDSLFYCSNGGDIDTFIINYLIDAFWDIDDRDYYQFNEIDYIKTCSQADTNCISTPYWIRRDVIIVQIIWGRGNSSFRCDSYNPQSIEINNRSYDVHILGSFAWNRDSIDKVYYSYNYGVIRYDYLDGETWELVMIK